eukprot:1551008-Amphidinium_carterae.1
MHSLTILCSSFGIEKCILQPAALAKKACSTELHSTSLLWTPNTNHAKGERGYPIFGSIANVVVLRVDQFQSLKIEVVSIGPQSIQRVLASAALIPIPETMAAVQETVPQQVQKVDEKEVKLKQVRRARTKAQAKARPARRLRPSSHWTAWTGGGC